MNVRLSDAGSEHLLGLRTCRLPYLSNNTNAALKHVRSTDEGSKGIVG